MSVPILKYKSPDGRWITVPAIQGERGPSGPPGPQGDSIVGPAGPQGPVGPEGPGYIITDQDKMEIAQIIIKDFPEMEGASW